MKQGINVGPASLPAYSITWGRAPIVERTMWLGEGDDCSCYLVNSAYVFRFAKHWEASVAMRVERCLLPLLRKRLLVAVPELLFAGQRDDTEHAMLGYRFLVGEPLERNVLESLPSTSQAALISQIADVARHLHALPVQVAGHCNLRILDPLTHLTSIMAHARTAISSRLADPVWRYYEDLLDRYTREPNLHTYRPALLHGDLSPDHLLADLEQVRLTGVIDFGDACVGDPTWDLVYIYEDYGPNTFHAFVERYDPGNARLIERKVQIYQHLNNVAYCLKMLSSQDQAELDEALTILEEQATAGGA